MAKMKKPKCASCKKKVCREGSEGEDCYGIGEEMKQRYKNDKELLRVAKAAAEVEAEYYCKATRIEEIAHFAKKAGYTHLGLAFCAGFSDEANIAAKMLRACFKVSSVCCKACAIPKKELDFPNVRESEDESICNPLGQAELLNRAKTDFNIVLGLCVGHDSIFYKHSDALTTTLAVKDRVLGNNPVAALYCGYIKKQLEAGLFSR